MELQMDKFERAESARHILSRPFGSDELSRIAQQLLTIGACVVVSVLSSLPTLLPLGLPRLLARAAALMIWFSSLFLLFYAIGRWVTKSRRERTNRIALELRNYYHQLLDESGLNNVRDRL